MRRELIVTADGRDRTVVVEGPLPIADHRATLTVSPTAEGARVFWSAVFTPEDGADALADDIVAGYMEAGLDALRLRFGA